MPRQVTKSKTLQFTNFPELPKELRLKIWENAAQEPRNVEICHSSDEDSPDIDENEDQENDKDEDVSEDEDEIKLPKIFYSPTAIPSILHTNHESRTTALEIYTSHQFPSQEVPIFYNPSVDILYFPPWCFERDITTFERWISSASKSTIAKIAIENLIWFVNSCQDGNLNGQIQISDFRNLQELYFVGREPDNTGCGCCHEFHVERGVVTFETEEEEEENKRQEEVEFESGGWSKAKGSEEVKRREEKKTKGRMRYQSKVLGDVKREFECILERDPGWKVPEIIMVRLKRDGTLV